MAQKADTALSSSTGSPWLDKYIRPHVAAVRGFLPGKTLASLKEVAEVSTDGFVKLNSNENLYGCSPKVIKALANLTDAHLYPDHAQNEFRELMARYAGVSPECIVGGSGGTQMMDLAMGVFVGAGDEVIFPVPSYGVYQFRLQVFGANVVAVPRNEDFSINVAKVKKAVTEKTKMIVLVNPNNPTGNLTPQEDIIEILDLGIPVLVDEAYYEFCGETVAPLLARYENVLVLRTFSKWAGLAGIRIGYGIFSPNVANQIWKIMPLFSVSAAGLVAARESLYDLDYLMSNVHKIVAERERMFAELQKISYLKPFPSKACFILCAVEGKDAKDIEQKLQSKGILIRLQGPPSFKNHIRISIGKPEHTDALLRVLKKL
jgi:histidinol-phosphate aminotransferase